jgi:hypothetical protein
MANKQVSNLFQAQSNSIASYNYTDIAEGTGNMIFYCGVYVNTTTTGFFLSQNALKSIYTSYAVGGHDGTDTDIIDADFDLSEFNMPKTIKGTARIMGAIGHRTLFTTRQNWEGYVTAKLRKWDGTTETEIATATSQTISFTTSGGIGTITTEDFNVQLSIPNPIHFKRGDVLRVSIIVHTNTSGTNGFYIGIGVDPANREDIAPNLLKVINDDNDTDLRCYIPFRLDEIGL